MLNSCVHYCGQENDVVKIKKIVNYGRPWLGNLLQAKKKSYVITEIVLVYPQVHCFNHLTYGRGLNCLPLLKRARTQKVLQCQKFEKLCIFLLRYKLSFSLQGFIQKFLDILLILNKNFFPGTFQIMGAKT